MLKMIESHLRYLTAINICADLIPQVFVLDAKLSENLPTVKLNPFQNISEIVICEG